MSPKWIFNTPEEDCKAVLLHNAGKRIPKELWIWEDADVFPRTTHQRLSAWLLQRSFFAYTDISCQDQLGNSFYLRGRIITSSIWRSPSFYNLQLQRAFFHVIKCNLDGFILPMDVWSILINRTGCYRYIMLQVVIEISC